jgi:hypothetical protein
MSAPAVGDRAAPASATERLGVERPGPSVPPATVAGMGTGGSR